MAKKKPKKIIGWREWVGLPQLQVEAIKVKVDTGARTSALHAFDIEYYTRNGKRFVRFKVHPLQRSRENEIKVHAPLLEKRVVKSSIGHESHRPVILTEIQVGEDRWPIELTLVNRDVMGFRMLLGRQAIRGRYIVDPGQSFLID